MTCIVIVIRIAAFANVFASPITFDRSGLALLTYPHVHRRSSAFMLALIGAIFAIILNAIVTNAIMAHLTGKDLSLAFAAYQHVRLTHGPTPSR